MSRFISIALTVLCVFGLSIASNADSKQWYKGSTHVHTLWSDGDAAPEVVVDWYQQNGYDFVCLSEHNILADGSVERWYPISDSGPLTPARVEALEESYGKRWVKRKTSDGREAMRLKTIPELKRRFEKKKDFLLIPAVEITSVYPAIHVNAINIAGLVPAVNFVGTTEGVISNLELVRSHAAKNSLMSVAHINHPNWQDGYSAETLFSIDGPLIFEVINGHSHVRNQGDDDKGMVSTDRFWDIVLANRLQRGAEHILYGIGTSDSHEYFKMGPKEANPGRCWVMVYAESLDAESIAVALDKGDFYASSGVVLDSIDVDRKGIQLSIQAQEGVEYTTQFIGTRKGVDTASSPRVDGEGEEIKHATQVYSEAIGEVLYESTSTEPRYTFTGDELYVRVKIVSSKEMENPFSHGGFESAWLQPVLVAAK